MAYTPEERTIKDRQLIAISKIVDVFEELQHDNIYGEENTDDVMDYILQRYGWQNKYSREEVLRRMERICEKVDKVPSSEKI